MSDYGKTSGGCEGQEVGLEDSECWRENYGEIGGSIGGVRTRAVCRGWNGDGAWTKQGIMGENSKREQLSTELRTRAFNDQ